MNMNSVSACLLMLGATITFAESPPKPTREPVTADPNDPEKNRPMVSQEEREKVGLTRHTWTGVVHPDVYPTLEKLNRVVGNMKERLDKEKDEKAFDTLHRVRFEGTVYVQVQLKSKDAQRRVLASLNASEFHVQQLFENSPGFVGYAKKEALDKLAKNADVLGVCLDDKPLPERRKVIVKDNLPPAKPGDTSSVQPGVAEGKVDADVYRAFDLAGRVDVIISLHGESLPQLTDKPSEMRARLQLREQAEKQLQDRVLSSASADDFWPKSRRLGPALSGLITKEGVEKLSRHPDVFRIGLQHMIRLPERNLKSR